MNTLSYTIAYHMFNKNTKKSFIFVFVKFVV